jgi:hypothetical protein
MRRYLTTLDIRPTERGSYQWALVATGFWAWATDNTAGAAEEHPTYPHFDLLEVPRGSQSLSNPELT